MFCISVVCVLVFFSRYCHGVVRLFLTLWIWMSICYNLSFFFLWKEHYDIFERLLYCNHWLSNIFSFKVPTKEVKYHHLCMCFFLYHFVYFFLVFFKYFEIFGFLNWGDFTTEHLNIFMCVYIYVGSECNYYICGVATYTLCLFKDSVYIQTQYVAPRGVFI